MTRRRVQRTPAFVLVPAGIALAFLLLPLLALMQQAPWGRLPRLVTSDVSRQALLLSLEASLSATALAAVFGVPLAWLLARDRLPAIARALVVVPLLLPPVVSGVALLAALGRRGMLGGPLFDVLGLQLPFSTAGVVVAETFVAMPFLVITLEGGFRGLHRRYEDAAATLGAGAWLSMRRVTIPMVAPSLVAGLVLCWARALGEFGATITFAGNFPGVTQTMPLAVYTALESDRSAAIALSLVLLAVSVGVLTALRGRYLTASTA